MPEHGSEEPSSPNRGGGVIRSIPGNEHKTLSSRKKSVACRHCHVRKIRCSGGSPCTACLKAGTVDQCIYQTRNRQVKVAESFLKGVLAENEQLRRGTAVAAHSSSRASFAIDSSSTWEPSLDAEPEEAVSNPLIHERAWFVPYDVTTPPIYIGEAACTAFATRFRQSLSPGNQNVPHVPRTHYVHDEKLSSPAAGQMVWPSRTQAELLLKVALANVNRSFHVVLPKETMASLDQAYRSPSFSDSVVKCKLFALFALGEVYSRMSMTTLPDEFPGLPYFIHSCSLIQVLPERANLGHIEALILLSFYSHNMNRRNSAYFWIGSALRLGMTLGMHNNLPQSVAIEPIARQHRIRLWWTIYICENMWASKLSQRLKLRISDITVDLPTMGGLSLKEQEEFSDPEYIIASVKLATITGDILSKIYCRRNPPPFVQSVQAVLRDLKAWMARLHDGVRLNTSSTPNIRHIVSLHLSFNQCVILATRPVLLHVFMRSRGTVSPAPTPASEATPITSTLAEACLHAARHSSELLTQLWTEGTLSTFGYFDAQYLFSSAVILAISGASDPENKDNERLESLAQLLQSMANGGNLSAMEFRGHLDLVRSAVLEFLEANNRTTTNNLSAPAPISNTEMAFDMTLNPLTTEMALLEQPMQDFLTQAEFLFDFPNPVNYLQDSSLIYSWPHGS
ncbi:hypothetical protein BP5796_12291 [Coleophoma crateriformis]|uniref:Zn(2)-C6 fungal-type domain-containing protein n=1 Tax=Coleophoma crateriformis TaxID=565419 RepID=A0A3D8Q9A7_9HELO|nr:hypothetical protein BP5796_12291 [Coleophoma crateriformis]